MLSPALLAHFLNRCFNMPNKNGQSFKMCDKYEGNLKQIQQNADLFIISMFDRIPQVRSCHQRGCSGAGVGVGMLRRRGTPLLESKKASKFQICKAPSLQNFKISKVLLANFQTVWDTHLQHLQNVQFPNFPT